MYRQDSRAEEVEIVRKPDYAPFHSASTRRHAAPLPKRVNTVPRELDFWSFTPSISLQKVGNRSVLGVNYLYRFRLTSALVVSVYFEFFHFKGHQKLIPFVFYASPSVSFLAQFSTTAAMVTVKVLLFTYPHHDPPCLIC